MPIKHGQNGRKAEGLLFGDTPIFDLGAMRPLRRIYEHQRH